MCLFGLEKKKFHTFYSNLSSEWEQNILVSTDAEVSPTRGLSSASRPNQWNPPADLLNGLLSPRVRVLSWGPLVWASRLCCLLSDPIPCSSPHTWCSQVPRKMCLFLSTRCLRKKLQISFLRALYCSQNFIRETSLLLGGYLLFYVLPHIYTSTLNAKLTQLSLPGMPSCSKSHKELPPGFPSPFEISS